MCLENYPCSKRYNCCSCGDNGCGCGYCWDCNACSECLADWNLIGSYKPADETIHVLLNDNVTVVECNGLNIPEKAIEWTHDLR